MNSTSQEEVERNKRYGNWHLTDPHNWIQTEILKKPDTGPDTGSNETGPNETEVILKWSYDMTSYYSLSAPTIILCIQVLLLNTFVIFYYKKTCRKFVPMMYIAISIADILSAVGFIHQSIASSLYHQEHIGVGALDKNFLASYFITSLSYRTSVLYNVVLGVSRTINILKPFYRIKKKLVIAACIVYPVIWLGVLAFDVYDFVARDEPLYLIGYPLLGLNLMFEYAKYSPPFMALMVVFIAIPFIIPSIIVVTTCSIQIFALYHNSMGFNNNNQRKVTTTIVLLSVLFVVCNSAYMIYLVLVSVKLIGAKSKSNLFWNAAVFATLLPVFNAAFNPVIIITRSGGVRERFSTMVKSLTSRESGSSTTKPGTISTSINNTTSMVLSTVGPLKSGINMTFTTRVAPARELPNNEEEIPAVIVVSSSRTAYKNYIAAENSPNSTTPENVYDYVTEEELNKSEDK